MKYLLKLNSIFHLSISLISILFLYKRKTRIFLIFIEACELFFYNTLCLLPHHMVSSHSFYRFLPVICYVIFFIVSLYFFNKRFFASDIFVNLPVIYKIPKIIEHKAKPAVAPLTNPVQKFSLISKNIND